MKWAIIINFSLKQERIVIAFEFSFNVQAFL